MSRVREQLLRRLGTLPARQPSQAAIVERRFSIEGVCYERWRLRGPRDDIPAYWLMREDLAAPAPTLLALHPHGRQYEIAKSLVAGLAGESSRAYGLEAARAGFAVLIPDFPGFEERRPGLQQRKSNYALQGEAYERLLANQALVQGATLQGWMLADIAACLDVLVRDPRVDAERIGAIGQSYGGQEVLFGMIFDERLRAGVVSCGFSLLRLIVEQSISHNMALFVPGLLPELDFDALVPAIAPRPLYVIAGLRDPLYPIAGVQAVEKVTREAYARAKAEDRLEFNYFDGLHDLPPESLQSALCWLKRVLA